MPGAADDEIVPVTVPVALRLKPVGSVPLLSTQASGPTPPVAARGDE